MVQAFVLAGLATNRWIPVQPWHIAVLAALNGVVNAYLLPAQMAFITEMVDEPEALSNAIALNSLRFNLARVLGPMLAGVMLLTPGGGACFFLNAISFICGVISLNMSRLPGFVEATSRDSVRG